jgi:hypothetical protein
MQRMRPFLTTPPTQIVPNACAHLFARAARWTHLRALHLTSVVFPPPSQLFAFPAFPALETLYIGRATCFPVRPVAVLVCAPGAAAMALRNVRLVDCYVESIWGGRVRRRDIEGVAAEQWEADGGSKDAGERVRRVRQIVVCEALTERIEGGDRVVDGMTILE